MYLKWKIYQKHQRENKTEILMNHPDIPDRPSQKVDSDFFYLKERQHLLMIDYLSKDIELNSLNSITAQVIITVIKSVYKHMEYRKSL